MTDRGTNERARHDGGECLNTGWRLAQRCGGAKKVAPSSFLRGLASLRESGSPCGDGLGFSSYANGGGSSGNGCVIDGVGETKEAYGFIDSGLGARSGSPHRPNERGRQMADEHFCPAYGIGSHKMHVFRAWKRGGRAPRVVGGSPRSVGAAARAVGVPPKHVGGISGTVGGAAKIVGGTAMPVGIFVTTV